MHKNSTILDKTLNPDLFKQTQIYLNLKILELLNRPHFRPFRPTFFSPDGKLSSYLHTHQKVCGMSTKGTLSITKESWTKSGQNAFPKQ